MHASVKNGVLNFVAGLVFGLVVLELALRVIGYSVFWLQDRRNDVTWNKDDYRILCLGESTTALQYPTHLEQILNSTNEKGRFVVIDKGIPSITTDVIIDGLADNLKRYRPHMVIAMMGLNDSRLPGKPRRENVRKSFIENLKIYELAVLLRKNIAHERKKMQIARFVDTQNNSGLPAPRSAYKNETVADMERALLCFSAGQYEEANNILELLLRKEPRCKDAYELLKDIYIKEERYAEAGQTLRKMIRLFSSQSSVYICLGNVYTQLKQYDKAREVFEIACRINSDEGTVALWKFYNEFGSANDADRISNKMLESHPDDERLYREMAHSYLKKGRYDLSEKCLEKAEKIALDSPVNPATYANYQELIRQTRSRNIKLVCMQYPTRSIGPLKKMLQSNTGIIYIDNEKLFKDKLKTEKYEEYFLDECYGDFGHCSMKGNELIAEHIADTILKELKQIN